MFFSIPIKLFDGGRMPEYKTEGASCADCYARIEKGFVWIFPGEREMIPLGFALELPEGYEAVIRPRSGMMSKGIDEGIGTIDSDYRGEVYACLINNTPTKVKIENGDRICQMKIQSSEKFHFVSAQSLSDTARGTGGFGSTGIK